MTCLSEKKFKADGRRQTAKITADKERHFSGDSFVLEGLNTCVFYIVTSTSSFFFVVRYSNTSQEVHRIVLPKNKIGEVVYIKEKLILLRQRFSFVQCFGKTNFQCVI